MVKIAGVVLAGGESRRMGRDKAMLELDGEPQLSRSLKVLASAGLGDTFVSGSFSGFNCIDDLTASLGPIGGISSCAETLAPNYDAMLLVPVDMPLLTADMLIPLLNRVEECGSGVGYMRSQFPMLLKLSVVVCDTLQSMLAMPGEERSVRFLLQQLQVDLLPIPEDRAWQFVNTNKPGEWQGACQEYYSHRLSQQNGPY